MLYKPNYCSHCGENVERIKWKFWTSSRFCENCESSFLTIDWLPKIISGLAVLIGLLGFGSYLKTPDKPSNLVANQLITNSGNINRPLKSEQTIANTNQNSSTNQQNPISKIVQSNSQRQPFLQEKNKTNLLEAQQNISSDAVYFCGAQTKKGFPCSRKVKGHVRCWQHIGQSAILSKNKLVVSQ